VDEETRKLWAEAGYQYKEGDLVGQSGVERTWEPYLRGIDGEQLIETNNMGQPINYLERKEPIPGNDLYLTIDLDLQKAVEEALARRVEHLVKKEGNKHAGRASAVILDPNSGAILALANYPSYDLNTVHKNYADLSQDPRRPLMNSAIQAGYPIGSTFKMVTATAALEKGVMSERDIIRCGGVVSLYGDTKTCYRSTATVRSTSTGPWPSPATSTSTMPACGRASMRWPIMPANTALAAPPALPIFPARPPGWWPAANTRPR